MADFYTVTSGYRSPVRTIPQATGDSPTGKEGYYSDTHGIGRVALFLFGGWVKESQYTPPDGSGSQVTYSKKWPLWKRILS